MKTLVITSLVVLAVNAQAQSIVGKWQLSDHKTCFQAEMKESDTEKELTSAMSSTSMTSVARVMTLDEKGGGEEGIFSTGKKKATSKTAFRYQATDSEFFILDKKSGLVTQRWVIDELTATSLKIHDSAKECETKSFIKVP
ncbi:MAG TPA: hypothetical protein VFE50_19040 [Cyclobacteriaceae bacterium]|nr:hypothetical protein [Cyclobacteriaceae bacterium]